MITRKENKRKAKNKVKWKKRGFNIWKGKIEDGKSTKNNMTKKRKSRKSKWKRKDLEFAEQPIVMGTTFLIFKTCIQSH